VTAMSPAPHTQRTARALAAAAVLLGITVVLTGELTPGYDQRYDTVSRLASPGQPFAMAGRSAIVAVGVLVTLTARALRGSAATYRRPVSLLVGVAGAAAVVVGIAPKDPPGVDPTAVSQLHVAASLIGVGALVAAMVYVSWSSPHPAERRRSATSLTLVVIAGAAFPFTWGSVLYGLLQRAILLTALAWLVATSRRASPGRGSAAAMSAAARRPRWFPRVCAGPSSASCSTCSSAPPSSRPPPSSAAQGARHDGWPPAARRA
jgi:hypothetical membrane protein